MVSLALLEVIPGAEQEVLSTAGYGTKMKEGRERGNERKKDPNILI